MSANCGHIQQVSTKRQIAQLRGGGRSLYRTCLSVGIPWYQGKEQGKQPNLASGASFSALSANGFNNLLHNSLLAKTGKHFQ